MYTIKLYGTNTNPTLDSDNLATKATVIAYTDTAADITANIQPVELDVYTLNQDFEAYGEESEAVNGWINDPFGTRDTFTIEIESISMYDYYTTYLSNLKNIFSYKYKFLEVTSFPYTIHSATTLIPVALVERSIETSGGYKNISFTVKKVLPN